MEISKNDSVLTNSDDYPVLLSEIKERIRSAQYEALKAVKPRAKVIR
jgi:hypothetical protein